MKPPKSRARLALLTLLFALTSAQPALAQVRVQKVFADLSLGPDSSGTWFLNNVDQSSVRWFTAVPLGKGATCTDCPFADNDQLLEITKVFHLLKGQQHARESHRADRSRGQRDRYAFAVIRDPATVCESDIETRCASSADRGKTVPPSGVRSLVTPAVPVPASGDQQGTNQRADDAAGPELQPIA